MREYQTPVMEKILFETEDIILASGDAVSGIVSSVDRFDAAETLESLWNTAWN